MCDHPNREAAMVVVSEGVWCDPCLVPLVKALNDGGLPTVASCCGHGRCLGSIALADGRNLVLAPDGETLDRLAVLKIVGADSRRAEEVAIVRDLAAERWPMAGEEHHCMLCGAYRGLNPEDHAESCPWRRAKELMGDSGE